MDKLDRLFQYQKEFDDGFDKIPEQDGINRLCTALIHEAVELQRHSNWKWWKKPSPYDKKAAMEELADIWHFTLSLSVAMDLSPEDLFKEYQKKHEINISRRNNNY